MYAVSTFLSILLSYKLTEFPRNVSTYRAAFPEMSWHRTNIPLSIKCFGKQQFGVATKLPK